MDSNTDDIYWFLTNKFQAQKTKQNLVVMNLIVSEFLISIIGVPLDISGILNDNKKVEKILCPATAFVHTILGIYIK